MNIKKSFLVALAATTAISSVSALAVSAAGVGFSTGEVNETFTVVLNEDTTVETQLEDADVKVTIPAGVLDEGEYTFSADIVVNADVQKAIDELGLGETEILSLYFTKGGEKVEVKSDKITVEVETTKYSYAYVYEDATKKLTNLKATKDGDKLSFKAPHFSYYVLATADKSTDTLSSDIPGSGSNNGNVSQASNSSSTGTNTGTNATTSSSTTTGSTTGSVTTGDTATATTVAVFAVMGVVALGTAVVASKMKKSSK